MVPTKRVIQGHLVRPDDVTLIRTWLSTHPGWDRTRLSRELCSLWDWRNRAGRLKDMACRSLLLKLQAQGDIRLPPRRTASVNGARNRCVPDIAHDQSPIHCPLDALRPLLVAALTESRSEVALFKGLLHRYHYLGLRNSVGENLKYWVHDRAGRPLGCLLFGSAAWQILPRDTWIGWDPEQRQRQLLLLTNNTRLLILPWVQVPHLASHLLDQVTARLSDDWQGKYGHPIYLVESFVERDRFPGTCYRAAGWIHVGASTGRSRNDPDFTVKVPIKEIFLKPLIADLRRRLAP